jgi:hypothetical protein
MVVSSRKQSVARKGKKEDKGGNCEIVLRPSLLFSEDKFRSDLYRTLAFQRFDHRGTGYLIVLEAWHSYWALRITTDQAIRKNAIIKLIAVGSLSRSAECQMPNTRMVCAAQRCGKRLVCLETRSSQLEMWR